jgi:hypothetical protein
MPVQAHAGYQFQGELDGIKTFWESVRIHPPQRIDEVVLRFPGGITLEGAVVDASGRRLAKAEVTAWREYLPTEAPERFDGEHEGVKTGEDGRFSIPVRRHARYQLVASDGVHANSKVIWVETSPEQPHAEVRLALLDFATIKGRVLHGDRSPLVGARVGALPSVVETSNGFAMPNLRELFGKVKDVTTGDDGSFTVVVHPAVSWTLRAMPDPGNPALAFEQPGVAAGRDDVELRIGDRELAGCTVRGTVTRANGRPVGPFRVQVFCWEDDKRVMLDTVQARADVDGDAFTLSALPLGRRFALLVVPQGEPPIARHEVLAPAQIAPLVTDRTAISLEVKVRSGAGSACRC